MSTSTARRPLVHHEIAGVTVLLHDHQDALDEPNREGALATCNAIVSGVIRVGMFGEERQYLDRSAAVQLWAPLIAGVADHGWPPMKSSNGLDYLRSIAAGNSASGPLEPGVQNSAARILVALGSWGNAESLLRILNTSTQAG